MIFVQKKNYKNNKAHKLKLKISLKIIYVFFNVQKFFFDQISVVFQ